MPNLELLKEQRLSVANKRRPLLEKVARGETLNDIEQRDVESYGRQVDNISELIKEQLELRDGAQETENRTGVSTSSQRTNLSKSNYDLDQQFRSAIFEKNPAEIEVSNRGARSEYQPGAERRDLLKSGGTGTQSFSIDVYDRIIEHMVESSAVLKAGATVLNTPNGESLVVPKTTGLATSALVTEGSAFSESDPTLGNTTLGAYKYGHYFQMSKELLQDGHIDLLDVLTRLAAESVALKFGNDLINGDGSAKPRGILVDATNGKTGPVGTSLTFGTQSTAGQGTDLLWDTRGALAEPYAASANFGWLMRNSTLTALRKLKDSAGNPVAVDGLGPIYMDPFVPALGVSAKSVIAGDFSRYVVRFAGPLRFERSDDFAFINDLVTFKVALRLDAATVDNNAFVYFTNSAT